jgi:hypothetical protein
MGRRHQVSLRVAGIGEDDAPARASRPRGRGRREVDAVAPLGGIGLASSALPPPATKTAIVGGQPVDKRMKSLGSGLGTAGSTIMCWTSASGCFFPSGLATDGKGLRVLGGPRVRAERCSASQFDGMQSETRPDPSRAAVGTASRSAPAHHTEPGVASPQSPTADGAGQGYSQRPLLNRPLLPTPGGYYGLAWSEVPIFWETCREWR